MGHTLLRGAAAMAMLALCAATGRAECPKRPPCPAECELDKVSATCKPKPDAPGDGKTRISSEPSGATVYIDGKKVGRTPWEGKLRAGKHKVRVELSGYEPQQRPLQVSGKGASLRVELPSAGRQAIDVRATADPRGAGAALWIDGQEVGRVPRKVTVTVGRHLVEIKRPGSPPYSQWIEVGSGETIVLDPLLGGGGAAPGVPEEINRLDGQCKRGVAAACRQLGRYYDEGQGGVSEDDVKANAYYLRTCELGEPSGCNLLGIQLQFGKGAPRDAKKAAEYYKRSCDQDNYPACANLAELYENGNGVPRDLAKARALYKKACDLGDEESCPKAAGGGGGGGAELEALDRACTAGKGEACFELAYKYDEGQGVAEDNPKAARLYQRACDKGIPSGCHNLGVMYDNGEGIPTDDAKAIQLYTKACNGDNAGGCYNLALMYDNGEGTPVNDQKAATLYRKACEKGSAQACTNLGAMYAGGEGMDVDLARAAMFYQLGCDGGSAVGCRNLGIMYAEGDGVPRSDEQSKRYFKRACDLGNRDACARAN